MQKILTTDTKTSTFIITTTESSQVVNTFALQLPLPRNVAINGNRWDSGAYFQLSTGGIGGGA